MSTVMNTHRPRHVMIERLGIHKVCLGLGVLNIIIGLAGIISPGLMGMHLSLSHNLIHLATGALAFWGGFADDRDGRTYTSSRTTVSPKDWGRKAYTFSIAFGSAFGLMGLAGFIFGEPGYPGVGYMAADDNLLRVIPNVLEFGSADHIEHLVQSIVLLGAAYAWKKRDIDAGKTTVDIQSRSDYSADINPGSDVFRKTNVDVPNSQSNLRDADLGRSDINRSIDQKRRSDFENRI